MIQARSNSDFDVKTAPIQFYGNSHNSQSECQIGLKFYMGFPDMLSYRGLKFQINRSSKRHLNTEVNRGCTNFVIYFLLTCGLSLFGQKSTNSTKIFNGLQHSFQVWQGFIIISESFSYKDSLFILATKRKEDFRINSTFRSISQSIWGFLMVTNLILAYLGW